MATRSAIGFLWPGGMYSAVYCHWDGAPAYQLPILQEHYNDYAKVEALIAPGAMSSLRTTEVWGSLYNRGKQCYEPCREPQPLYYSEQKPHPDPAFAHQSKPEPPVTMPLKEAYQYWRNADCEYLYVFADDEWKVYPLHMLKPEWGR